jgi:hypothetical protein
MPMAVLLKTFYEDILRVMFMNTECENCDISILSIIIRIVVHYSSCEFVQPNYDLVKAETCSSWYADTL